MIEKALRFVDNKSKMKNHQRGRLTCKKRRLLKYLLSYVYVISLERLKNKTVVTGYLQEGELNEMGKGKDDRSERKT